MDEVDLLLHPLKAELNFPIGALALPRMNLGRPSFGPSVAFPALPPHPPCSRFHFRSPSRAGTKHPLDFSPERWTCAIHALDAVFYLERKSMSVPFHQSGRAHRILEKLQAIIEEGYELRALQRSPHLVLLNVEWYHQAMRPIMAQWMMLWLEANHVAGLSSEQIEAYITSRAELVAGTHGSRGCRHGGRQGQGQSRRRQGRRRQGRGQGGRRPKRQRGCVRCGAARVSARVHGGPARPEGL